ncbi:alkene reductase [Kineococcus sp. NUM-3379]
MTTTVPTAVLSPTALGDIAVPHRLAMSPMTRDRSRPDGTPSELNVQYYAQRASMGLLITEGTQPSPDGQGYLLTPGIHAPEHVAGWARVADAVHAGGGKLVLQLMHAGRIAHPSNTPHGRQPVAPSPVQPAGHMYTATGPQPMPVPRELSSGQIAATVADYARAAALAVEAGADGVEIHAANGYLPHQFLSSNANRRTDAYGGSVENRIRFTVEVATAVAQQIGAGRTGLRISPANPYNDIVEEGTAELYTALVTALDPIGLAYLHVLHGGDDALLARLRGLWSGALVLNRAGTPLGPRFADLADGTADVVTIGTAALANPDLLERLRTGAPLNEPDRTTFYGGDARGYTDYPTLAELTARIPAQAAPTARAVG